MSIRSIMVPLIVGAIIISACSRKTVSLDFTNAKGEVPQLGNLVFRFSNSMVGDSLLNNWDSTEYIRFSPSIPGRFRWHSPDELVFSPSKPLDPATTYSAEMTSEVLRYSKFDKVKNGDEISFKTPDLTLNESQVIWMLLDESNTKTATPHFELFFNYRVKPDDLKEKLSVEVEGEKMKFELLTVSPENKFTVRVLGVKAEDRNYETKLRIEKGLRPEVGLNKTEEDIESVLSIPSPYSLTIQNVEAEHDGLEGTVNVTTSQQITSESLRAYLKVNPDLAFTAELTDNGFLIRSDKFNVENSYALVVLKGLRGKIGGVLREDITNNIAFGELEANIGFNNSKAVYLSKKGSQNIGVRITNVGKVKLVISKVYENNLLFAHRYGYYPQETQEARYASHEYSEEGGDYYYDYGGDASMGDVIYEKEIDTRSLPKNGAGRLLDFKQFEDRLPDFKGIYHVMIRSTQDYWVRDSRFISVSDIGLIAKEGKDKIFVFANSLKNAAALNGVMVSIYGNNNQLLGSGSTNGEGVAEIAYAKKDIRGFNPAMIIAKTEDDFNYLPFNNSRVNTSRFEVGGKRNNPTGFDAFVYAERDIYRTGEKVNFSVILRDQKWSTPTDIPIKLKFLLPNGKELKTFRKSLNEQGSVEGNVEISTSAITGTYVLEVYSSNDILLASKNFMIEEFVPDRIRVNVTLDRDFLTPGVSTTVKLNAMNFFGPPAANRNYETEIQVKQKMFSPKQYKDYNFSLANANTFFDKVVSEGKTDQQGNASQIFQVKEEYKDMGLLQTNFYVTVFDETGRPVSRLVSQDVVTQNVFLGIKQDWSYYFSLNQAVKFPIIALNKDGKAVSTNARVQVIKKEYNTHLVRSGSYFRYESQQNDKLITEEMIRVSENSAFTFIPRTPGRYELRIFNEGASTYVKREFYSYGSWGADNSSFEVNNEGHVDIEPDKEFYQAGETAKLLFKTPFSGRLLVTVEMDKVISYQYVNVDKRTASIDLKLTQEHLPNVYVTATLIKPHDVSDIPLTVAHGFRSLTIEEKKRKIPVEITAAKSVRSRTTQEVKVKATPGSFVTLAAVDNGVLQVSGFKTPDPYNYFYQKKALQVLAYDLYPLLFPELRTRSSSTGGDGEVSMEKRVNPMPAKRVQLVSYWSGIAKANGNGVATFKFSLPQFSGEVRLMAVAYKNESFGSGETTMTVADPVVISSAIPRFLSPGDTVTIPVTLSNTTSKNSTGKATLKVSGPLKVVGTSSQDVSLGSNSETAATFAVVADPSVGTGKISVEVNAMGEKFIDETEISVRPPSTLQKIAGSGSVNGGSTQRININTSDFMPGSINYQLVVSRSPVVELADQLRFLVQYPYGCTEQTVSAAFPQLYYGDLADLMQQNKKAGQNANSNVIEAIRKIKMRQLYNGALTLWDGEGTADWWTTVYAAHFLLEAKKAGFDVDNSLLETMLGYIANRLKTKETIDYYYNRTENKKIAPKEVAYGLYVLALASRPNVSAMNYYKSNKQLLALDSRYLLSAAYAVSGDKKSFNALLPASFSGEESVPQTGGSFYSYLRDEAIALNALIDVDPGNAQIGIMAKHVADKLKGRDWYSTQERAFSFLALGKLARAAAKADVTADVRVNGKVIASIEGGTWKGDMNSLKGTNIEIITKGSGKMYYSWVSEGISSSGRYIEEDNFIKVRREFFDRNGNRITSNNFSQNDLIIVGITLENSYSTTVENIVITDLIPAGFEIENPRTKEIPGMDWIKDASTPVSLDVRDDRIHFFVDLTGSKQVYYYAVRAVSPGNFKMGPVSADAMYNGEYHSYHGAGMIRISKN